jgi:hypothetical protein
LTKPVNYYWRSRAFDGYFASTKEILAAHQPKAIVDRIADRVDVARKENIDAGGSGIILQTPNTMGAFSENYSVQPSTILLIDFI